MVAKNLTTLNAYLKGQTLTPALGVLVELARTLARDLDGDAWTPAVATEYRRTLDTIATVLGDEADDGPDTVRLLSTVVHETG